MRSRWPLLACVPLALAATVTGCSGADDGSSTATSVPNGVAVSRLEPGTCFQRPESADVRTVEQRDCDEPHDAEAYAVFEVDAAADEAYPSGTVLASFAQQGCQDRFADYVGMPYEDSPYYFAVIVPSRASWGNRDDRRVVCSVIAADRAPLEASVKAPTEG